MHKPHDQICSDTICFDAQLPPEAAAKMFMALLLSCKILGEGARALAAAADAREAGIALFAGGHHCVVCALTRSRESPEEVLQARRIRCFAWVWSQQGAAAGRICVVRAVVRWLLGS